MGLTDRFKLDNGSLDWDKLLFYGFATLILIIMIPVSWGSGISGDEFTQYDYGVAILDWFMNFGELNETNKIVIDSRNGIHTYSSSFDFFTAVFNKVFGIEKEYEVRHVFNAISGWLLILLSGLIAKQILGWRAGLVAMFLLFLSPRLLGHSWNNPKDIPFALTYILGIYFIVRFAFRMDNLSWKDKLFAGLAIGSSIGIRIGGLLLIAYLFLFVGLYFLYTSGGLKNVFSKTGLQRLRSVAISTIITALIAYIFGIMFWPFALDNPIENPLKALALMSDFAQNAGIRQLYDGKIVWSDHLPPYYTIHYIFMTTPLLVLFGFIASFFFLFKKESKQVYFWKFVLLFSFGFPILYIFIKESMVYSGWRHTLFTYPTLAICAALGIEYLIRLIKVKRTQYIALSLLPVLAVHPLIHTVKNSPYQYIYFNEVVGSVDNIVGKYESDYYYHSSREAYNWIIDNADLSEYGNGNKLRIGTNAFFSVNYFARWDSSKVKAVYQRYYDRGNNDWDYYICVNNYINPDQLKRGLWPPSNTVYEVKVDNSPIGIVLKRATTKDLEGHNAMQRGEIGKAIGLLEEAIQEDPMVESAYLDLAECYMKVGQFDKGIATTKNLLKVYPKYDKAFYTQSIIYLNAGKFKESIEASKTVLKLNPKFDNAYYMMSLAYLQAGDPVSSLKYIKKCLEAMPGFKPGYLLMVEILKQQGRTDEANYYQNIANQL